VPTGFDVSIFAEPIPPLPNVYPNMTKFHGKTHVCRLVKRQVGMLSPTIAWECVDLTLELIVPQPEGPIWRSY